MLERDNLVYYRTGIFGLKYSDFDAPCSGWIVQATKEANGFAVWTSDDSSSKPHGWYTNKEDAIDEAVAQVSIKKEEAQQEFKIQATECSKKEPGLYRECCQRYGMENVLGVEFPD